MVETVGNPNRRYLSNTLMEFIKVVGNPMDYAPI